MRQHNQWNDQDICWKIWGSNIGNITNYSSKHADQLQCPPNLQFNEIQSFFSGTHTCLEASFKFSGAMPQFNLSTSMVHSGTTLFYLNHVPMCISLKRSHPFWSYKGTFLHITFRLHTHYMIHLFNLYWSNYINIMKNFNNKTHIIFCVFLLLTPSVSQKISW